MIVVDSSGWLEYFIEGPNAGIFESVVADPHELIVPSITIYEVFKQVARRSSASFALRAASQMQKGEVIDLDSATSIAAAQMSIERHLPMADSIILTTARLHDAILWTQDADFDGMEGVKYVPARS
ncbi:MAG: type II toxin-antitoxin system VapC family toxin [Chloroflexi bacterium]|nr:type II toxin-antitoxin system VapC family toxin [Chloroflexota bacterium]